MKSRICLALLLAALPALAAEEPATVAIHPMEANDVVRWSGLKADAKLFKEGAGSGRWESLAENPLIRSVAIPHDWTPFAALQFWLHSARANGQAIKVLLYSNNPATEKTDLFGATITLDWEGWRLVRLPFCVLSAHYTPVGWNQIDAITIAGGGFGLEVKPDTVVHLDDVRLVRARPGMPVAIGDFETDAECWRLEAGGPLERVREPTHEGEYALRWEVTPKTGTLYTYQVPTDWRPYTHLELWMHCPRATEQRVKVLVLSNQAHTPETDGYVFTIPTNWEGWQMLSLPLHRFGRAHDPAGPERVTGIRFICEGYGMQAIEGTVFHLDGVRLVSDGFSAGVGTGDAARKP